MTDNKLTIKQAINEIGLKYGLFYQNCITANHLIEQINSILTRLDLPYKKACEEIMEMKLSPYSDWGGESYDYALKIIQSIIRKAEKGEE